MKKVSLVVMGKEREDALVKLRSLGVVHLERKKVSSARLAKLLECKTKTERACGILRVYAAQKKEGTSRKRLSGGKEKGASISGVPADSFIDVVLEYADKRKKFQDLLITLGKERRRLAEWGDYDPRDILYIEEKGAPRIFLYKIFRQRLAKLPDDARYIVLGGDKNFVRLAVFDNELSGELQFVPGRQSLSDINAQIAEIQNQLADTERQLVQLSGSRILADNELKGLLTDIEFENAHAGMELLPDTGAEKAVAWITGYVPKEDLGLLKRAAAEYGWALGSSEPGPDDAVPTKLKNNRFVRLLNPLTDFLNVTPGYHEADVSLWFLLFFTIFFGMIYGDAVYGAIFVIIAVIGIVKTRKKGVKPIYKLTLLLGTFNFIWGVLTCNWLGLDTELLPAALKNMSLPLISSVTAAKSAYDEGIVKQHIMIFCFTLGLLQLSIGHIIAITRSKNLKILSEAGSLLMLAGMYGIVLSLIASNEYRQIPLFRPCIYALGGGFILNFVFANYEGSIGRSIIDGFKNMISAILGIANVFGDIMSYIRLWAVGLAGGAIASTINSLAGPLFGHFIWFIFGVILMALGHSLNFVLNGLSVLVHGVRLNTLEFSSHAGLTWAGTAYRPFKKADDSE